MNIIKEYNEGISIMKELVCIIPFKIFTVYYLGGR